MQSMGIVVSGLSSLLLNNPQCVDRFNKYSREIAIINAKKTKRTDEDYLRLANLEIRSKIYWDDELNIYIPTRWVMAAIAKHAHKIAKSSKAEIRGSVFLTNDNVKLHYKKMDLVKTPEDIVGNDYFRHKMILPQGQVRIAKSFPIFKGWSFTADLEFDSGIIDPEALERILKHACKYGGFGDFRPTFGRAEIEVTYG